MREEIYQNFADAFMLYLQIRQDGQEVQLILDKRGHVVRWNEPQ